MRAALLAMALGITVSFTGSVAAAQDKPTDKATAPKTDDKNTDQKTTPKPAEKDATQKQITKPKAEPKDTRVVVAELTGKLVRIESAQKVIAIRVSVVTLQSNRRLGSQDVEREFVTADDLKVRLANPPLQHDEKGNLKKYTSKELKALKGNSKEPGYPGDFDSLKTDQIIRIVLKKAREQPRQYGRKPATKDKDAVDDNKPVVTNIYILAEPQK